MVPLPRGVRRHRALHWLLPLTLLAAAVLTCLCCCPTRAMPEAMAMPAPAAVVHAQAPAAPTASPASRVETGDRCGEKAETTGIVARAAHVGETGAAVVAVGWSGGSAGAGVVGSRRVGRGRGPTVTELTVLRI